MFGLGILNIKLGLENIRSMLACLGCAEQHPRIIHIAGTNGKGSTLIAIESLLLRSGFTTGSTVSPHLIKFNERFRINGRAVSDEVLDKAFGEVCKVCGIDIDRLEEYSGKNRINPTFFEFSVAMAFVIFARYQVDYVLLETGLGGRLDATNVVRHPLACVFTKIAFDHQEFLGDSIESIANEKLGILKPGAKVFIADQEPGVTTQIKNRCREKGNRFLVAGGNFICRKRKGQTNYGLWRSADFNAIPVHTPVCIDLDEVGLHGVHQLENIATALTVYLSLVPKELRLDRKGIAGCIRRLQWPARLQYLDDEKKILLDGAHNVSGMISLVDFLEQYHAGDSILLAISWMEGKEILPAFHSRRLGNSSFQPLKMEMTGTAHVKKIAKRLKEETYKVLSVCNVSEFIRFRLPVFLDEYDLVVVAGSLYLIGEFLTEYSRGASVTV